MELRTETTVPFCEVERETLFHLFWCCRIVQSLWKILENWLIKYKILPEAKSIDKLTALGLKSEYETPLARNHIYTNKLAGKEPNFLRYLQLLKQHAFFENQALKNTIYKKKWKPLTFFALQISQIGFESDFSLLLFIALHRPYKDKKKRISFFHTFAYFHTHKYCLDYRIYLKQSLFFPPFSYFVNIYVL